MNTLAILVAGSVGLASAASAEEICWAEIGYPVTAIITDESGSLLYGTSDLADCETPKEGYAVCVDEAGNQAPVYFTISGDVAEFDYFGGGPKTHRKIDCD